MIHRLLLLIGYCFAATAWAQTPPPPPPDLENSALHECTRYCFVSLMPGATQNQCIKLCNSCKNTDPKNTFKQGVDAKCDKKTLFCMQQAGATFAKTQTCEARANCFKKHTACILPLETPTAPAEETLEIKPIITSDILNQAAHDSCNHYCVSQPKAIEAKCNQQCLCKPLTFDTGINTSCDEQAQTCMQQAKPQKCAERQKCLDNHLVCVKPTKP